MYRNRAAACKAAALVMMVAALAGRTPVANVYQHERCAGRGRRVAAASSR
jgi:hypothetical protein